jgi:hypothetical protein
MDESNYTYFNFNEWGDNSPKWRKPRGDDISRHYKDYILAENELEDMITDGVVDISVDKTGIFHYHPSKQSLDAIKGFNVKPKYATFADILTTRGLDIHKYIRYKNIMRRLTP